MMAETKPKTKKKEPTAAQLKKIREERREARRAYAVLFNPELAKEFGK